MNVTTEKLKIWDPEHEDEDDAVEYEISWINPGSRNWYVATSCERWCDEHGHDYLTDGVNGWTLRVRYADGTTDDFEIEVEAIPSYSACRVPRSLNPYE